MTELETVEIPAPVELPDEAPMVAHIVETCTPHTSIPSAWPPVALCGKPVIGQPAPDDAPTCLVCEELMARRLAERHL